MRHSTLPLRAAIAALCLFASPTRADTLPPAAQAEIEAAWKAGGKAATMGPAQIPLLNEATLRIDPDEAFIPAAEANRIMQALGNRYTPARYGLVVSRKDPDWLIDVTWIGEGYVRDSEAKEWQPESMLTELKQATESANADRIAHGMPAMDITGWVEQPRYDAGQHRLIWSLAARDRGAPAGAPQTINYNTYALGRDGYFSLDLITSDRTIGADKAVAQKLLASLDYTQGKRYQDFDGSTDKVAAYGIGALVGLAAAKKLGFFALAGVFLLKIWKLAMLAVVGGIAAVRRFFGRKTETEADA